MTDDALAPRIDNWQGETTVALDICHRLDEEEWIVLDEEALTFRATRALTGRAGFSEAAAQETVRHLLAAERAGKDCHGLIRLRPLLDGTFRFQNQQPPEGRPLSHCGLAFDGAGYPGYVVAAQMMREAKQLAARNGICLALGQNVYPSGYLGYYGKEAAEAGFIAHIEATSPSRVTSPGHKRPYVGTNPLCRAYPVAGGLPAVIDLATSAITHGDLLVAQASGAYLPPDAAVDANGRPAMRAEDFDAANAAGAFLPYGGRHAYKSFALALSVGLQCSFSGAPPAAPKGSGFGISMLLIDASALDPGGDRRRADWLVTLSEAENVRIPGWQSIGQAKDWERRGEVRVARATWKLLQKYI